MLSALLADVHEAIQHKNLSYQITTHRLSTHGYHSRCRHIGILDDMEFKNINIGWPTMG
jgi:hypothetical protein